MMKPYVLTIDDETYTDEDLTMGMLIVIAEFLGDMSGWATLTPWVGPRQLTAFAAAHVSFRRKGDINEEFAAFTLLPAADALGMISARKLPLPPPADDVAVDAVSL
jgi:hypothetical protein